MIYSDGPPNISIYLSNKKGKELQDSPYENLSPGDSFTIFPKADSKKKTVPSNTYLKFKIDGTTVGAGKIPAVSKM